MEKELIEEKFKHVNQKLSYHEDRLSEVEDKLVETDKNLAVSMQGINTSLDMLSGLPKVISKVSESITKMGGTMDLMQDQLKQNTEAVANLKKNTSEKFKDIQDEMRKIDEEGKFNLRTWFRDNWLKLLLGGSVVGALVKHLSSAQTG